VSSANPETDSILLLCAKLCTPSRTQCEISGKQTVYGHRSSPGPTSGVRRDGESRSEAFAPWLSPRASASRARACSLGRRARRSGPRRSPLPPPDSSPQRPPASCPLAEATIRSATCAKAPAGPCAICGAAATVRGRSRRGEKGHPKKVKWGNARGQNDSPMPWH